MSWTIPSTRADGQALPLSELKGYELYYSIENQTQSAAIPVSGGSTSSYVLKDLKPGTYYFAISAVDSNGVKSALSAMVAHQVGQ